MVNLTVSFALLGVVHMAVAASSNGDHYETVPTFPTREFIH
jgi:hypothetical protein